MAEQAKLVRAAPPARAAARVSPAAGPGHEALEQRPKAGSERANRALLAGRGDTGPRPIQKAASPANRTGLPDRLKAGVEALSGISLDGVKVHYNSAQPAKVDALGFARGRDIHLGPGQEKYLPHEAWHVVQQAQGRVRPTRQMKSGIAVNDSAALEQEADLMGAKAAGLGGAAPDPGHPLAPATRSGGLMARAPVQRFKEVGPYHISNDDTAAVGKATNNKELYATTERIDEANRLLGVSVSNVRFTKGAAKTHADKRLLTAKPVIDGPSVQANMLGDTYSPVADASPTTKTGVHLPSECEKGAVAIIGAFVQDKKLPGNAFVYLTKDHSNARIANLIAQSPAGNVQKQQWYDEWVRIEALVDKAAAGYNQAQKSDEIDLPPVKAVRTEVFKTDPALARDEFLDHYTPGGERYVVKTARAEGAAVLRKLIRALDEKLNAIERTVMSSVDDTYRGYDQDVTDAKDLRDKLVALYAANSFPKATVDAALNMTGQTGNLAKYFAIKQDDPASYANNLSIFSESRMKSFLEELVAAINTQIVRLEARREGRFGTVGNQNKAVDPKIGEAYGIIGGQFDVAKGGRWNWHWAGVVLKTPTDNVTMEAHASHKKGDETHNESWDFKMYGRPMLGNEGKTFHEIWRGQGFGKAPVTMVGEASDARVVEYHLEGHSLDEVNEYRAGADLMFKVMTTLSKDGITKEQMVEYYFRRIDDVLQVTNKRLPRAFVEEKLHPELNDQLEAMFSLKNEELGLMEEIDLELKVIHHAKSVAKKMQVFYVVSGIYQGIVQKRNAI